MKKLIKLCNGEFEPTPSVLVGISRKTQKQREWNGHVITGQWFEQFEEEVASDKRAPKSMAIQWEQFTWSTQRPMYGVRGDQQNESSSSSSSTSSTNNRNNAKSPSRQWSVPFPVERSKPPAKQKPIEHTLCSDKFESIEHIIRQTLRSDRTRKRNVNDKLTAALSLSLFSFHSLFFLLMHLLSIFFFFSRHWFIFNNRQTYPLQVKRVSSSLITVSRHCHHTSRRQWSGKLRNMFAPWDVTSKTLTAVYTFTYIHIYSSDSLPVSRQHLRSTSSFRSHRFYRNCFESRDLSLLLLLLHHLLSLSSS